MELSYTLPSWLNHLPKRTVSQAPHSGPNSPTCELLSTRVPRTSLKWLHCSEVNKMILGKHSYQEGSGSSTLKLAFN